MNESIVTFIGSIFICAVTFFCSGCGSGGKEDDTASNTTSSSSVELNDCSGATFPEVNAEELAELVEAADEDAQIVVEEAGLDQEHALRLYKLTIIQGCGNHVSNEDNDSVSDDDVSVSVPQES